LKRSGFGSLLFVLSIFCLWVGFNGLFMVPGKYDATVVSIVIVALALAFGFALASGKQFVAAARPVAVKAHRTVFSTMPMIVWFVVVLAFGGLLLLKFL